MLPTAPRSVKRHLKKISQAHLFKLSTKHHWLKNPIITGQNKEGKCEDWDQRANLARTSFSMAAPI